MCDKIYSDTTFSYFDATRLFRSDSYKADGDHSVTHQNVFRLDIAVNDIQTVQVEQGTTYLCKDRFCIFLHEKFSGKNDVEEFIARAVLHDHHQLVRSFEHIDKLDYVWML